MAYKPIGTNDKKETFQLISSFASKKIREMIPITGETRWKKRLVFKNSFQKSKPSNGLKYKMTVMSVNVVVHVATYFTT